MVAAFIDMDHIVAVGQDATVSRLMCSHPTTCTTTCSATSSGCLWRRVHNRLTLHNGIANRIYSAIPFCNP